MTIEKNHEGYLESQLCIPQDRLEDIDFFPNFNDDFIRLTDELLQEFDFLSSVDDNIELNQESSVVESTRHDEEIGKKITDDTELSSMHSEEEHSEDCYSELDDCNINLDNVDWSSVVVKKPRTKKLRKVNRKLIFPLLMPTFKARKGRRCVHCQSERTPQWRMGPMGPNTLCNACGLRYKSGRLAASPSFDGTKNSNFCRRRVEKNMCEKENHGEVVNG